MYSSEDAKSCIARIEACLSKLKSMQNELESQKDSLLEISDVETAPAQRSISFNEEKMINDVVFTPATMGKPIDKRTNEIITDAARDEWFSNITQKLDSICPQIEALT